MIKAAHPYENKETGECCDPLCPCHQFARQDTSLVQVPLEHVHDFRQAEGQSSLECACGAVPDYSALDAALTEEDKQQIIGAMPLQAFPLEHPQLRSLTEAERNVRDALLAPFDREWHSAPPALRIDYTDAYYWYLVGHRHGRQEVLEMQVEDLREIERLVSGRME